MKQCLCGSFAINPHCHGRQAGVDEDLCDVCYWRHRAQGLRKDKEENWDQAEKNYSDLFMTLAAICQTNGGEVHYTDAAMDQVKQCCVLETWRDMSKGKTTFRVRKEVEEE